MQPYLLELYKNPTAYGVAGLAAAILAAAQIAGGMMVGKVKKIFSLRSSVFIFGVIGGVITLTFIGVTTNFYIAAALLILWALVSAAAGPIRKAYLNDLIASHDRATVLSFDSLVSSSGGVVFQPLLGKVADVYSLSIAYCVGAFIQLFSLPFLFLIKKEKIEANRINRGSST